jgi:hypothetical protein
MGLYGEARAWRRRTPNAIRGNAADSMPGADSERSGTLSRARFAWRRSIVGAVVFAPDGSVLPARNSI